MKQPLVMGNSYKPVRIKRKVTIQIMTRKIHREMARAKRIGNRRAHTHEPIFRAEFTEKVSRWIRRGVRSTEEIARNHPYAYCKYCGCSMAAIKRPI